jgi:DNA gyrase subunit B
MQWNDSYAENVQCFTNNIRNATALAGRERGEHPHAQQLHRREEIAKKAKVKTTGDDMREGLCCVLSVKVPEPKFSSQTKDKLVSSEVQPIVQEIVAAKLKFCSMPRRRRIICTKIVDAARARWGARARELTAARACSTAWVFPGKLADCQNGTRRCARSSRGGRFRGRLGEAGRDRKFRRSCRCAARCERRAGPRREGHFVTEIVTLITALGPASQGRLATSCAITASSS